MTVLSIIYFSQYTSPVPDGPLDAGIVVRRLLGAQVRVPEISKKLPEIRELIILAEARAQCPMTPPGYGQ